jgi:hypothetical protein
MIIHSGEYTARLAWASARAGPPIIFFIFLKRKTEKGKGRTQSICFSLTSHLTTALTLSLSLSRIAHHRSHSLSLSAPHHSPSTVDRRRLCHNSQQPSLSPSVMLYSVLRYQSQTLVFSNLLNLVVVVVRVNCVLYCKLFWLNLLRFVVCVNLLVVNLLLC